MSHIATVDVEITDLDDLDAACKRIGLELTRGQQTYNWFGDSDREYPYPLPAGFEAAELGKCDHAIRVPGDFDRLSEDAPYEIGVMKRRDGKPGWCLMWDPFCDGQGIGEFLGDTPADMRRMSKLKQAYAVCAARRVAQLQGFRLQEVTAPNGTIRMVLTK